MGKPGGRACGVCLPGSDQVRCDTLATYPDIVGLGALSKTHFHIAHADYSMCTACDPVQSISNLLNDTGFQQTRWRSAWHVAYRFALSIVWRTSNQAHSDGFRDDKGCAKYIASVAADLVSSEPGHCACSE
jgi:hypothetical protein